jgi:hypothetical protein
MHGPPVRCSTYNNKCASHKGSEINTTAAANDSEASTQIGIMARAREQNEHQLVGCGADMTVLYSPQGPNQLDFCCQAIKQFVILQHASHACPVHGCDLLCWCLPLPVPEAYCAWRELGTPQVVADRLWRGVW